MAIAAVSAAAFLIFKVLLLKGELRTWHARVSVFETRESTKGSWVRTNGHLRAPITWLPARAPWLRLEAPEWTNSGATVAIP
jgi:hypothetical protein